MWTNGSTNRESISGDRSAVAVRLRQSGARGTKAENSHPEYLVWTCVVVGQRCITQQVDSSPWCRREIFMLPPRSEPAGRTIARNIQRGRVPSLIDRWRRLQRRQRHSPRPLPPERCNPEMAGGGGSSSDALLRYRRNTEAIPRKRDKTLMASTLHSISTAGTLSTPRLH